MPIFDWQFVIVILTLAAAASYLVRRGIKTFRAGRHDASGAGACGSCGSCDAAKNVPGDLTGGFVPLEELRKSPSSPRAP
jgi:hypothetical protein